MSGESNAASQGEGRRLFAAGLVVVTHVVLPLGLLLGLATTAPAPLWVARAALAATYAAFLYFGGAWAWLSIGLRPMLPVFTVATIVATLVLGASTGEISVDAESVMTAGLAVVFGLRTWQAWRGRIPPDEPALALTFPLQGGTFVVGQGGSSLVLNHHARHPGQRYALDIVAIGPHGRRAQALYPRELGRYAVWDMRVVSPCDGIVVAAIGDVPDSLPPYGDARSPRGNHVAIRTADATIHLAHLRQGSLLVAEGDTVVAGQPLGRVGNSGNTSEPHLHIHAERSGEASGARGMPLVFAGRFLVRNDCVPSE